MIEAGQSENICHGMGVARTFIGAGPQAVGLF